MYKPPTPTAHEEHEGNLQSRPLLQSSWNIEPSRVLWFRLCWRQSRTKKAQVEDVTSSEVISFHGLVRNKQQLLLSTTEEEYVSTTLCCTQLLWIKLEDFNVHEAQDYVERCRILVYLERWKILVYQERCRILVLIKTLKRVA